ncbi:hypothetical protein [Nocardia sp. CY41]|uniref:hypothetical protein n=1 Tax=Nocardia sp. CY41 TaxID=2608686 RepID=UPI001359A2A7|nr:hypothetical protein [Nocardia sp. CY41]
MTAQGWAVVFVDAGARGACGNNVGALIGNATDVAEARGWAVVETFWLEPGREGAFERMMAFVRAKQIPNIVTPHVGHLALDEARKWCDVVSAYDGLMFPRLIEPPAPSHVGRLQSVHAS